MSPQTESLFHELVDLTEQQRIEYYAIHGLDETVRTELERLFSFDGGSSDSLVQAIGDSASRTLGETAVTPGTRCGPYRLLELLGQGGMGAVYRAERADGEITQQVAIKTLHAATGQSVLRDRFIRERQLLAQLNHPSIARLLDAGHTEEGLPYLVMEYVDGVPIDQFAAGRSLEEQIGLVIAICEAVTHAHRHLIIHRDLKPSNILVEKSGCPKLLDFGIAKLLDDSSGHTQTTDRMLTPAYASPEQIRGDRQTTATDVYSLGAVLYRVITGRSPHEGDSSGQRAVEIATGIRDVTGPRQLNTNVPMDLDCIVRKALRREPEARYSSMESLASDLRRFLLHKPITARPESLAYRTSRFVRRNRVAVALGGIAAGALLAGVASTLIQARATRIQRDFAIRHLARAEEISDLNSFLLSDAAPQGRPFMVLDLLTSARRIAEHQIDDTANRAGILTSLGAQYLILDEPAKSRDVLDRAYALSRTVSDPSVRSRAACALAMALPRTSDTARANSLTNEGLRELPADPVYSLDRAYCLQNAAAILRHAGAGEEAISNIQAALKALKQAPYHSKTRLVSLVLDLAESYRIAGKLRESASTSEGAAELMKSLGRSETQRAGTLFNNWALTLNLLGRPLEAERIYRRAIDIGSTGANERGVSPMLLLNYGRVLTDLDRHREAEEYVQRAYSDAKRNGREVIVAQSLIVKASIYRGLEDVKRASDSIDEFDLICRRVFPPGHAAFASMASQRSLNAQARGDLATALGLANEAVSLTEAAIQTRSEGREFLPVLLLRRSEVHRLLRSTENAVSDARRALGIFQEQAQPGSFSSQLGRAYLSLGRALRQQGDRGQAHSLFLSAGEHLRNSLGAENTHTLGAVRLSAEQ